MTAENIHQLQCSKNCFWHGSPMTNSVTCSALVLQHSTLCAWFLQGSCCHLLMLFLISQSITTLRVRKFPMVLNLD